MKEGEWYEFQVGNIIELPEAEPKLVLMDSNGMRYLIPANPYHDYKLNKGEFISCKVDKINCTGRIFLEPQHPYYQEDKIYQFKWIRREVRENILKEPEYTWVLHDKSEKEIALKVERKYFYEEVGNTIECQVVKIKKAKLYLHHPYSLHPKSIQGIGLWQDFVLLDETVFLEKDECYVLQDKKGEKFILKMKHFNAYGFKTGMNIQCKIVKWNTEGRWVIEPKHPLYNEGEVYPFVITEIEEELSEDQQLKFFVNDFSRNKILVKCPVSEREKIKLNHEVDLRVTEISKGKPVLFYSSAK